jgi:hypothetical protein
MEWSNCFANNSHEHNCELTYSCCTQQRPMQIGKCPCLLSRPSSACKRQCLCTEFLVQCPHIQHHYNCESLHWNQPKPIHWEVRQATYSRPSCYVWKWGRMFAIYHAFTSFKYPYNSEINSITCHTVGSDDFLPPNARINEKRQRITPVNVEASSYYMHIFMTFAAKELYKSSAPVTSTVTTTCMIFQYHNGMHIIKVPDSNLDKR